VESLSENELELISEESTYRELRTSRPCEDHRSEKAGTVGAAEGSWLAETVVEIADGGDVGMRLGALTG